MISLNHYFFYVKQQSHCTLKKSKILHECKRMGKIHRVKVLNCNAALPNFYSKLIKDQIGKFYFNSAYIKPVQHKLETEHKNIYIKLIMTTYIMCSKFGIYVGL